MSITATERVADPKQLRLADPEPMLTIDQVAIRQNVNRDAVSHWINTGELPAVNVARSRTAKRPSWRIRLEDLQAFEFARSTTQPAATRSKGKKPKSQPVTRKKWF